MARPYNHGTVRPETTPLYTTSVYTFPSLADVEAYYEDNAAGAYVYRRNGHPNEGPVEAWIADLEGAEAATLCASGMAAISQACMAWLNPGDHVLASRRLYGGSYAMFEQVLKRWGVSIDYVDIDITSELEAHLRPNTKLLFAETIANPLVEVADLAIIRDFCSRHQLAWFVDNTFATPLLVRPLDYGATLSIHSTTKYINGHSDVIGGAVVVDADTVKRVRQFAVTFGGTMAPFDAWQTERGLQTLHLRYPAQCQNALRLAQAVEQHPAVARVYYPGLPSHSSHETAKRILRDGFGAMMAIDLVGGYAAADTVVRTCQHIQFAPSLGGVLTTLSHPGLTSHRAYSPHERAALGITDGLLRLSVGAEPFDTVHEDLVRALDTVIGE